MSRRRKRRPQVAAEVALSPEETISFGEKVDNLGSEQNTNKEPAANPEPELQNEETQSEAVKAEPEVQSEEVEQVKDPVDEGEAEDPKSEADPEATDREVEAEKDMSEAEQTEAEKPQEEAAMDKPKKKKLSKAWRAFIRLIIKLCVIALVGFLVWTYVGEAFILHDNNMYPHIKDGTLSIIYKLEEIANGDVVLFVNPNGEKKLGRIVAHGEDVVEIEENGLYMVNDYTPYENVFYQTKPATDAKDGGIEYPYVVEKGTYFIMNDMRDNTNDSRAYGSIPADSIIGKVVLTIEHRGF